jgi:hypothetical protein
MDKELDLWKALAFLNSALDESLHLAVYLWRNNSWYPVIPEFV